MKEEAELDETLTPQLVKQGIGIARDKRYAGNNMTSATKAMDKLHRKLQNHPRVAAELKKQNEEANPEAASKQAKKAQMAAKHAGEKESLAKKHERESVSDGHDQHALGTRCVSPQKIRKKNSCSYARQEI